MFFAFRVLSREKLKYLIISMNFAIHRHMAHHFKCKYKSILHACGIAKMAEPVYCSSHKHMHFTLTRTVETLDEANSTFKF